MNQRTSPLISVARLQELAVRLALGAPRVRLFQQRLTESVLLALMGGACGTGLAYVIVQAFVALAPVGIPRLSEAAVDGRVLLFAVLLSLASGIVFGTLPALEKPTVQMLVVKTMVGTRGARLRQMLLAAQVWMAVVLLASAMLFVRSLLRLETEPLGMNPANIVAAQITLGQQKYSGAAERLRFFEELERKLKELPGFASVALHQPRQHAPCPTWPCRGRASRHSARNRVSAESWAGERLRQNIFRCWESRCLAAALSRSGIGPLARIPSSSIKPWRSRCSPMKKLWAKWFVSMQPGLNWLPRSR